MPKRALARNDKKREAMASAVPRTTSHKMNCHPERSEGPMQLAAEGKTSTRNWAIAKIGHLLPPARVGSQKCGSAPD